MKHSYIIFYLILLTSSLFSQKYLAILDIEPMGLTNTEAKLLTEKLTTKMMELSDYDIIERSKIINILKEKRFQSICKNNECAVEIGNLLNAELTLIGTVSKTGEAHTFSFTIIMLKVEKN